MATERVNVTVWEYLQNESERFKFISDNAPYDGVTQAHIVELMESYASVLSLLSQQQKERDENGNL